MERNRQGRLRRFLSAGLDYLGYGAAAVSPVSVWYFAARAAVSAEPPALPPRHPERLVAAAPTAEEAALWAQLADLRDPRR